MANGNRGTTLVITAGGPNPPKVSNVGISFADPVSVIGGNASFSGVPEGNEPQALGGFTPTAEGGISLGGSYKGAMLMAIVAVPTGNTIDGKITSDPPLPFPLQIQSFAGGSYTLAAGETSGSFSFPFSGDGAPEAKAQ
jgi:hypothetical protein